MAYAIVNKSGCVEGKGNVQIRLDFYLEPDDPRYEDRYLNLVDTSSPEYLAGYQGVVDEQGNPTNQQDYDKWFDALPRIWANTPFHSHFIYLSPDTTDENIKAEMAYHLPNFYTAFQNRWDEVNGGMRHGWATEKRIRPKDFSKDADYATRKLQCEARVSSLTEVISRPDIREGREFPATAIVVGPGAVDRTSAYSSGNTNIEVFNPANGTGILDTFELWAATTMSGTNKVGTFYGSDTDYTNRAGATIGTVTAGAKRTFTGLSISVSTGDFAGIYFSSGTLEAASSGGSGVYLKGGDQFGTGLQTYGLMSGDRISIYATGATLVIYYQAVGDGSLAIAASLNRKIKLAIGDGSVTIAGALSSIKKMFQTVGGGSVTIAGSLATVWRRTQAVGNGLVAIAGSLGRKIGIGVGGASVTPSGSLGWLAKIGVGGGSVTLAATLGRNIKRTVGSGAVTTVGALGRKISTLVGSGAITMAGALGRKTKIRVGGGAVTLAATLGRNIKRAVGSGAVAIGGSVSWKIVMSVGNGTIAIVGTLRRKTKITVGGGSVAIAGVLSEICYKLKTVQAFTGRVIQTFTGRTIQNDTTTFRDIKRP